MHKQEIYYSIETDPDISLAKKYQIFKGKIISVLYTHSYGLEVMSPQNLYVTASTCSVTLFGDATIVQKIKVKCDCVLFLHPMHTHKKRCLPAYYIPEQILTGTEWVAFN